MNRRNFCGTLLGGAAALGLAPLLHAAETPPNIILITADDLGIQLNSYGDMTVPTPHLNQLADEGVLFQSAYVTQASCSPSRSSMFTGLYPHQNNQLGLEHRGYVMHKGIPTLPALLKANGYRNGSIGKVHVRPAEDLPFDFQIYRQEGLNPKDVTQYAKHAETFINETGDQPFFLLYSLGDPHKKFFHQVNGIPTNPVKAEDMKPFAEHGGIDTPEIREEIAGYYNAIQRIDVGIRLLRDLLKKTGKDKNTLIIFIGDHGAPLSRGKTTTYEFGLRIPFLVHWPERIQAKQVRSEFISTVDILPTCLEAAGLTSPKHVAGQSLLPMVTGASTPWRDTLCAEFTTHGPGFTPQRSIRDKRYKLILNLRTDKKKSGLGVDGCKVRDAMQDSKWEATEGYRVFKMLENPPDVEFYDLQNDPIEYHNLAGKPELKAVESRLKKALLAWRQETHDPLLDPAIFAAYKKHHDEFGKSHQEKVAAAKAAGKKAPYRKIDMTKFQETWPTAAYR
ncbi:MAG: sulfatase [Candidatus Latescibacteria bacterium]|jgi:N-sulfoglucosamine sulfohydrolase|nr:sulfatase [Candidatus Latescibacterota bacterium]